MARILKEEIKTAIKYITESRDSHIPYVDPSQEDSEFMNELVTRGKAFGGTEHHKYCIKKYNFVIDVLERMK